MSYLAIIALVILIAFLALLIWRLKDVLHTNSVWKELKEENRSTGYVFDPNMVKDLPEPVRRFFLYSIEPGTTLQATAELDMIGELGLGTKSNPQYMPMKAQQILSPPHGFIWKVSAGRGLTKFSGSDAAHSKSSWSRFWLLGILPIARAGNNQDHYKSSFGRYMSEAVMWLPGSILPSENVNWQKIDNDTIQVRIEYAGLTLSAELILNQIGQPIEIKFDRWSNANPKKKFRWQPFGGYLSEYEKFGGYMLPTKIEAGNMFKTDDYFPFFKAKIKNISFGSKTA